MTISTPKYIWNNWTNKTPLEEAAIKAVFRAREIVLENIPNENIVAIYAGGSLIRRELNEKSDVDTWVVVNKNGLFAKIDELYEEYKDTCKPQLGIAGLSLWELKHGKRYGKSDKPKANPSRFLKKVAFYQLIYGKPLNINQYPIRSDEKDLQGMIEAFNDIFIPLYLQKKMGFQELIKQVFWLVEAEQRVIGQISDYSWRNLNQSIKDKNHIIHAAYHFRNNSTKDEELRKIFLVKLKNHLNKLSAKASTSISRG